GAPTKKKKTSYTSVPSFGWSGPSFPEVEYDDWSQAQSAQIYHDIDQGEGANQWTAFQLDTVNELRVLYSLAIQAGTNYQTTDGKGGGCDAFRGAHIVMNDNARWYYYWASCLNGHTDRGDERWSSHYDKSRKAPQSERDPRNAKSVELQFEILFPYSSQG